jgi:hypothetical protein
MIKIEKLLEEARMIKIMEEFHDSHPVGPELAAIYIRIHEKTLARLRQSKNQGGLPYFQVPTDKTVKVQTTHNQTAEVNNEAGDQKVKVKTKKEKTTARNQPVSYLMSDLRKYRASIIVNNTMEAATLRGMTFSTLSDLFEEYPFWIKTIHSQKKARGMGRVGMVSMSNEVIVGQLQTVSEEEFKRLVVDPDVEIRQLSLDDAMTRHNWADDEARGPFHSAYIEVLQQAIHQSNTQQERATLNASLQ